MYRITQLKLDIRHSQADLVKAAADALRIKPSDVRDLRVFKRSVDARKKPDIFYVYTVDVEVDKGVRLSKKVLGNKNISRTPEFKYEFRVTGEEKLRNRPVIIGTGPAGLFCGLFLARAGFKPILFERGKEAHKRKRDVERFWEEGVIDPQSNVQFGEGGAGTFSDGKLNTMVKDEFGRNRVVLEEFVNHGASEEILYINKPHIGTDKLIKIVTSMREEIISLGGEVRFNSTVYDFVINDWKITGVRVVSEGKEIQVDTDLVVLACGHSSRDTFAVLNEIKVPMEAKSFAVGVRVIHPQRLINMAMYGVEESDTLPAADYKVTYKLPNGRGVYSFCMCPGGYVVNASSDGGELCVNGMSYSDRGSKSANSAIIVTVDKSDFPGDDSLSGVRFQQDLEKKAYELCKGSIPVQLYADFKDNRETTGFNGFVPDIKGKYEFGNIREIFSDEINESLIEGMEGFGRQIHGFNGESAIFAGLESRTSSPVRILRDEAFESLIKGLYPCGEGAGYAGGITSAAMDGIKVAEAITSKYKSYQ